jgi:hypothetical protein
MLVWRLVLNKIATLDEIDNYWCFDDIIKANELLDIKDDVLQLLTPKIEKGNKTKL